MEKTVWVRQLDLTNAWMRWSQTYPYPMADARKDFAKYLNDDVLPLMYYANSGSWELSAEGARKMRMLLGPHAQTIIKAAKIRMHNGIKERESKNEEVQG